MKIYHSRPIATQGVTALMAIGDDEGVIPPAPGTAPILAITEKYYPELLLAGKIGMGLAGFGALSGSKTMVHWGSGLMAAGLLALLHRYEGW